MAAFNVRIFGYNGTKQVAQGVPKHFNADSIFVREEPYLWSQIVVVNGAAPVASTVQANDKAKLMIIEVPDGQSIRYELNPNGPTASNARNAGNTSPRFSGIDAFEWFSGATFSFVDAASFP